MRNVLIVDNHALTRIGLKTALQTRRDYKEIIEAESGEQAIEISKKVNPDLVILDIVPLGVNGIQTIKQLKRINNDVIILILTNQVNDDHVLDSFCAGVKAYCMKTIDVEKLLTVIDAISEGAIWLDPAVSANILQILTKEQKHKQNKKIKPFISSSIKELTERETDVLRLIVDGYNNAEISEKLCVSIHTAKAHVCNILHKLCVEDRTQAAILALKNRII